MNDKTENPRIFLPIPSISGNLERGTMPIMSFKSISGISPYTDLVSKLIAKRKMDIKKARQFADSLGFK